jgi:16S rRNA (adenine1518-N6/adenine1519-N6)-dimethyltransferase
VVSKPHQPTLRRIARFGVRPKHALGQNFLIDSNILGVIGRAAELDSHDVVLEIGGGLGVLSEYLARHAAHVHVVELDASLEPALRDALDPFDGRSTLHLLDAMELDLAALQPLPSKVVANLPYGIAASVILRTIEELDSVTLWIAMVQREVGERFAATPAARAQYGIPSVLAQLACDVQVLRRVPRTVFYPVPRVDSVLVRLVRHGAAPPPGLREFVRAAFAHRRKTLAGSLAQSIGADPEAVRSALCAIGKPPQLRAESLSPSEFRRLWEAM